MQNNPFANVQLRRTAPPVERGLANFKPEPTQPIVPPPPPGSQPVVNNNNSNSQPNVNTIVPPPPGSKQPSSVTQHASSSNVNSSGFVPSPPGQPKSVPVVDNSPVYQVPSRNIPPPSTNSVKNTIAKLSSSSSSIPSNTTNSSNNTIRNNNIPSQKYVASPTGNNANIPLPPPGSSNVSQSKAQTVDDELDDLLSQMNSFNTGVPLPPGSSSQPKSQPNTGVPLPPGSSSQKATTPGVPLPPGSQPKSTSISQPPTKGTYGKKNIPLPPLYVKKPEPKALEFYQGLCDIKEQRSGLPFKNIKPNTHQYKRYNSVGNSDIEITLGEDLSEVVRPNQLQEENELVFSFRVTLNLQNTQKHNVKANQFTMMYKDSNGQWISASSVYFYPRGYYPSGWESSFLFVGKEYLSGALLIGKFRAIKGLDQTMMDNYRYIAHSSLPQPLQLKVVIGDSYGESRELQIEQFNHIPIPNVAQYEKIVSEKSTDPMSRYIFTEDLNTQCLVYLQFTLVDNALVINFWEILNDVYKKTFDAREIRELESKAMVSANYELEYDFAEGMKNINSRTRIRIIFLFHESHLYGARVFMETSSHIVEKVVYLRDLIRIALF